jgi:predicted nucleic acid-binding protein
VTGYLVDTNVPSELSREKPDARVSTFLERAGKSNVFLSVLTIGEICKGIDVLPISQKRTSLQHWLESDVRSWFLGRILPVTEAVAERWGHLAAIAKQRGMNLATVDGLIAATALHHDLTIVTRNAKDFVGL